MNATPTKIGSCELYLADCFDVLPDLTGVSVVVTDPPYGVDYRSGWATDELWSEGEIRGDADTAVRDRALAMLPGIPALVFGSRRRPEPAGTRLFLTWEKGAALGMGALDLPWKPSTEEIYVIGKGFVGRRDCGSTIYCPPVQSMAKNGRRHPNQKPVDLIGRLLAKCPPGRVLDPFMGSGTTGVACVKAGRPFIGVESDPVYFERAVERIVDAVSRPDLFVGGAE